MTYDDPRVVAVPKPAKSIAVKRESAITVKSEDKKIKQRFTVKHKAKWTITTPAKEEFSKLSNNLVPPAQIPEVVRSKVHNRFMDILPNPKTRVALSSLPTDPTSSYYNANYVRGADGNPKAYIASMGCVVRLLLLY